MRTIRICPGNSTLDPTGFYRGLGPLGQLRKRMDGELDFFFSNDYTWAAFKLIDVMFLTRPYSDQDLSLVKWSRKMGVPVWVDFDDLLEAIPESNPASVLYRREEVHRRMREAMRSADVVTFSTPYMAKHFEDDCREAVVIPNAFDDSVFRDRTKGMMVSRPRGGPAEAAPAEETPDQAAAKDPSVEKVVWRGTSTHVKDVWQVSKELVDVMKDAHPHYGLTMMGFYHWQIAEALGAKGVGVTRMDATDLFTYNAVMREIKPRAVIAPLVDCPFNRAKSNIAWLEAVYAGGLCVAPAWEEWNRPGCYTYDGTPAGFAAALRFVLSMRPEEAEQRNMDAWKWIWHNLRLSSVNEAREKIVRKLAARR